MSTTGEIQRKSWTLTAEATGRDRTFRFIVSTGSVDRDRDVIAPKGWRLDEYRKNPIVLWQHRRDVPPIARTLDIRVVGEALIAICEFPPEGASPLADEIHNLVAAGFLHSASVGFLPERQVFRAERNGWDILEATLLEWSIVNVPANCEATIRRCLGEACDVERIERWLKSCGCLGESGGGSGFKTDSHTDEVLLLDEELLAIQNLVTAALRRALQQVVGETVRRTIRYHQGKVD